MPVHDEHVEAPLVHPICQLGEDVGMPARAWRYQNVGSVESAEGVDQLQTLVIGMQRCTPEREAYFGRVGGGDVLAFPIIRCPHRLLFKKAAVAGNALY
jgi:hypothetical protein